MAIIGISGKINSGKDLVGKIIQYLLCEKNNFTKYKIEDSFDFQFDYSQFIHGNMCYPNNWRVVKFADKLKDIICLLIGCTREQLEDREFKETPLGEEWNAYRGQDPSGSNRLIVDEMDARMAYLRNPIGPELTPRLLLQLLGTQCGREIIHPNIWVNALFSDYKNKYTFIEGQNHMLIEQGIKTEEECMPNWIITDVRFPNEVKAIHDKGGIVIRVVRHNHPNELVPSTHESEIALDDYRHFDAFIMNNGTIEDLVEKVRAILISKKIIS